MLYAILEPGIEPSDTLRDEIRAIVGQEMGKPFDPREVLFVDEFPKTQSAKVVRRAIVATYRSEDIGDMSSIENPGTLEEVREPQ